MEKQWVYRPNHPSLSTSRSVRLLSDATFQAEMMWILKVILFNSCQYLRISMVCTGFLVWTLVLCCWTY